ncbi:Methyltransferase domain-containing protein [Quadrisphaera granulorum]|uniref:Methyltransferase family protein n=1 Tax=Quadrisphaera granulorum TaxID=317664 RepID=A0A316A600_9ACTN|nr:class I SAM-dependent methyltransferase [Quadrisphaera granulorum]PWJ53291.1 methyltransferase family protein [Quadrisphaera granulorum]SZE96965.1 Methyltransferase domain-containing protein [Quadrisphaera granulorum]
MAPPEDRPEADDEARRTSFGTLVDAERYDRLRPDHPDEAVAWLTGSSAGPGQLPGQPSERPLDVLDLAAGTGKVSRALARQGHRVVAVDPSEGMLAVLRQSLASIPNARVELRVGTAEHVPLPDGSVDAVVVGQAWHWLRPAAAAAEVARVLRPGGVLGLSWVVRDLRVPWAAQLETLLGGEGLGEATGADEATHGASIRDLADTDWWPRVPLHRGGQHAVRERASFPAVQHLASVDDVVDLASTYSGLAVSDRREGLLRQVRELATAAAQPDGSVLLPQVCHCFRYRIP